MRATTTDGDIIETPDMCGYCNMSTNGGHQIDCPLYEPKRLDYRANVSLKLFLRVGDYEILDKIK